MNTINSEEKSYAADGLGFSILNKIVLHLRGEILDLHYFDLDEQGKMHFLSPLDVAYGDSSAKNALVKFKDDCGNERAVCYISQDLTKKDPNFSKFLANIKYKVGNTFAKAIYRDVRSSPVYDQILNVNAEKNFSDAEEGRSQELPSRFPLDSRVIDIGNYISRAEWEEYDSHNFCYEGKLFVASRLETQQQS
ncbi:MAG: hypothetical protein ACXU8A_06050 [Burkholderiaceae bacterium]